jgi:tetratricopeptide (TPR) repeat protein
LLAIVLLVVLGSICFSNSLKGSLLQWDDQLYVQDNPYIRSFSWSNVKTLFTQSYFKNYAPLHVLSYQLDYHFWKFRPDGYKLVNILLHILNSILVFFLIFEWYQTYAVALTAAAIFAVHTIHVESVVWISQRKDVLSTLFFFLSLYAYSRFRKKISRSSSCSSSSSESPDPGPSSCSSTSSWSSSWRWPWPWYAASLLLAALALLTKAVTVTIPLVLVLYELCLTKKEDPIRWKEIIPFFLLSGLLAVATYWAQTAEVLHYIGDSFLLSLLLTVKILILYLGKLVLPVGLSSRYVFYVSKVSDIFTPSFFLYAVLLLLFLGGLVFLWLRQKRDLAFPGFWFLITLLPVANIIPTSTQMADRYMYLPSLGYGLAVGLLVLAFIRWTQPRSQSGVQSQEQGAQSQGQSGAQSQAQSRQRGRRGMLLQAVCILLAGGLVVLYGSLTLARNRVWHDDRSLWEDALAKDPNNYWAATLLANTYMLEAQKSPDPQTRGECLHRGKELYQQSVRLAPQFAPALLGMGSALLNEGNPQEAIVYLCQAREWNKEQQQSLRIEHNLGIAYVQVNQFKAAEETFSSIIKQDPTFVPAYFSLGKLYLVYGTIQGYQMAAEQYRRVTEISPNDPRGYFYLAITGELMGDFSSALSNYQQSLRLTGEKSSPQMNPADIHFSLAGLYYHLQDYSRAVEHYREVLRLAPNHPQAEAVRSIINSLNGQ